VDEEIWLLLTRLYASFVAGDRGLIDAQLDPAATIWDSAARELLRGQADLDKIRAARPPSPAGLELTPYDPVIRVYGDTAIACYWLAVSYGPAGSSELIRNTAVLLRRPDSPSGWRIVHLHEDVQDQS
jgi:hypothetical protein